VAIHLDRSYLRTENLFWNPDFLATALILPLLIAVSGMVWSRDRVTRFLSFLAVCAIMPSMILTGARGPELGTLAAVAYLIVRDSHRWKLASYFSGLAAIAGIVFAPTLASRWSEAFAHGGAGRTDIWRVGWVAFKNNWLFGAGFNNFTQAYNQVFLQVFQPLYVGWSHVSHNILVGNGVELGIVGLALLLFGWYTQLRTLHSVDEQDARYPVRLCLEAAVIGLFVSGLFADIMVVKFPWLAFMLINLTRNTRIAKHA
jgi:O-antigen ligase